MLCRDNVDPPDRWDLIGIIGLYEPARGHQGRRNNPTAGNHHHARPAFRARLKVTDLAIRSDTQADHPVRRHENPILDLHPADLHWTKTRGIPTHISSSPVTLAIYPRPGRSEDRR